eukprot:tig00000912_g5415.t1
MPPNASAVFADAGELDAVRRHEEKEGKSERVLTLKDVAEHRTKDDCWVIVNDKVYDVTKFVPKHPGGEVIITSAGEDATEIFSAFHAGSTFSLLRQYQIGTVKSTQTSAMIEDFRQMRKEMQRQGMFESNKLYYLWKLVSLYSIVAAAVYLLATSEGCLGRLAGSFLLGVFFQQSGWTAHDFLHHQVFKTRAINTWLGVIIGNVNQGFSVEWWKNKHNTHHAVPNMVDGDPDIDTLPLLGWTEKTLNRLETPLARFAIRHQVVYYFPLLCLARISWMLQSLMYACGKMWESEALSVFYKASEVAGLFLHYAWFFALFFLTMPSVGAALGYAFFATASCGMLLGSVFAISHNGMEIFTEKTDFVRMQAHSSRDVDSNIFSDWFTGGLNYQLEHHLFPTLPRHRLGKSAKMVASFCKKHNIPYESCSFSMGTWKVLKHLMKVSEHMDSPAEKKAK